MAQVRRRAVPRPILPALTLVLGPILASAGCGGEAPPAEPELRPVRYERVASASAKVSRTLAGTVRSGIESRLSFRVGGTVDRVRVAVGDRVSAGQELARLDPTDLELRVDGAVAALAQAQASLRKAEADYDRVRLLYENRNASLSELDAARAAAESAKALVTSQTKQLEQARRQVGYTVLRAPSAGAIASVEAEVNENVRAGEAICLLLSGGEPEVRVAVPEVLIPYIEVGQAVAATLDALPGRVFEAAVTEVGVAVTGSASTYTVTARLAEPDPAIRSGMAAEVRFEFVPASGQAGIRVPSVAVGEDQRGRFVFVLEAAADGTGTVHRRSVEVGRTVGDIEILEGLSEGELIVTAGVRRLTDGLRVRVLEDGGAAG